ncbi:MAG: carbohydrate ABC transporter permease [Oscillospiraceae bacterium]|nr:carbohydrate ABC transporter permease [Oscillospiraceae bacterium]
MRNRVASSIADNIYRTIVYIVLIVVTVVCFFPFYLVVLNSFTPQSAIISGGFRLFPAGFTLDTYKFLFAGSQVFNSYKVTVTVVFVGTVCSVLVTSMYAYVIAHPKVKIRRVLSFITYFAMLFGQPLVGFYILMVNFLKLKNTFFALFLPYLINPFYCFILVAAFREFAFELTESASIDGASDVHAFFRIVLPVVAPSIATIALFYALMFWNDWWLALLYIDKNSMHPLQMMLRQMISNLDISKYLGGAATYLNISAPNDGIKMATVCVTIGPILLVYPFIQRFFVKGIAIGAVKG